MKIVGLTGGIGSGKSTIAKSFLTHWNIPTYVADTAAKRLITTDKKLQQEIIAIFGEQAFINGNYNTIYISGIIFSDEEKLKKLNAVVHPAVQKDFQQWVSEQTTPYVLKESAILFESGSYKDCHWVISVVASEETRIKRVMLRDGIDRKSVEKRIKNQWTDTEREKYSTFIIKNEENDIFLEKIKEIHFEILKKIE